jgi:hypothetical protein
MADGMSAFRAPKTFGLAGVMRADARVFHQVIFELTGVGRVSDLFSSRLRRALSDELEFRASILFGVVDSHRFLAPGAPLRIECGVDQEKLGVSVSFSVNPDRLLQTDGMRERVLLGKGTDRIEQMLHSLLSFGEQVLFKFQPATGLAEACVLSLRSRGALGAASRIKGAFEVLVLPADLEDAPHVAEHMALGDLDYRKLLRSSRASAEAQLSPSGDVRVHVAADPAALQESIRVKDYGKRKPEQQVGADGAPWLEEDSTEVRISGVTDQIESDQEALTLRGPKLKDRDETRVAVGTQPSDAEESSSDGEESAPKQGFLKSLFSVFSKKEVPKPRSRPQQQQLEQAAGQADASDQADGDRQAVVEESAAEVSAGMREITKTARELELEAESGSLSKLVDRIERERKQMAGEIKNTKTEKWLDGLASELVSERARLAEMTRRLSQSTRQKELEFKNRENTLLQSMRDKDENLRAKTQQLMRMKDQVAKLQMSVERAKSSSAGADENSSKIKLSQTQRLLQSVRTENEQLASKMQEMRLKFEQLNDQRKMMVPNAQFLDLQRKYERVSRQLEDMKRSAPVISAAGSASGGPDDGKPGSGGSGSQAA